MKKLLLLAFLAFASINADAQFFYGLGFDVKWQNSGVNNASNGSSAQISSSYGGEISPQFGYKFNPDFLVGSRINFIFDKSYLNIPNEVTKENDKYISSSLGWDIAPFARYQIAKFGKNDWFSIWADVHAYYGMMFPNKVQEEGYITLDYKMKHLYGIQAMPAVGFKFDDKTTLFINVALLSLAYSGTCTQYDDGSSEYTNKIFLFTGKLSGLLSTLGEEGMYSFKFGLIRTL